jgi:HSP20 family molecular chaperone IbpA
MASQNEMTQSLGNGPASITQERRLSGSEPVLRPPVDVHETDEGITLRADMPGVSKDRLNLRVDGNTLLLEGTIGIVPQEQMAALYADVRSTTYRRQFVLSNELESSKIEANLQNGVLTIQIPKRAELRPRRIEISG